MKLTNWILNPAIEGVITQPSRRLGAHDCTSLNSVLGGAVNYSLFLTEK